MKKKSPAKKKPAPSNKKKPQPSLDVLVFLACDGVSRDPNTQKPTLYGLFDKITTPSLPARAAVSLYAKFQGLGKYPLTIELVSPTGKATEIGGATVECARDGFAVLSVSLNGIEFKRQGDHQFRLKSGGKIVGRPIKLKVRKRAEGNK